MKKHKLEIRFVIQLVVLAALALTAAYFTAI